MLEAKPLLNSLGLGLLILSGVSVASAARAQEVTEFPLSAGNHPGGITAGPDGDLWFVETAYDGRGNPTSAAIARMTPDGVITEFPVSATAGAFLGIAAGPDGNIWFTESNGNKVGRMTTAGVLSEFPIPTADSDPTDITAGPDGNLWFTEAHGKSIGRITTDGVVTGEFLIPTRVGAPMGITAGPDGALWFTEPSAGKVGRITTQGAIFEIAVPNADDFDSFLSFGIVTGPDGNLWFSVGTNVARMTRYGEITEFPFGGTLQGSIASGPDGNLWVTTDNFASPVARVTTAGMMTGIPFPTQSELASDIAAGPDGKLWVTEQTVGKIARITTGPCTANATTLCLLGGRFSARATWSIPSRGESGQAGAVPLSDNSGWFWFFDPGNIEMAVKVLDGCKTDGHEWVFAGGLTDLETTLTVVDFQGGQVRSYSSPAGVAFPAIQDTQAFAACPP